MDRYRRGAWDSVGVDIILRILHKQSIDRTDDSRRDRGMASGNPGHFWGLTLFWEYCLIDEKTFFVGCGHIRDLLSVVIRG